MTAAAAQVVLYAAVGDELGIWHADTEHLELVKTGAFLLPGAIQYGWRHPHRPVLYVATSDVFSPAPRGAHHVCALRIAAGSGALEMAQAPVPLAARPIHLTVDAAGEFLLSAHNDPASVTVLRLRGDGGIGEPVEQPGGLLPAGCYPHQVRVMPAGDAVIVAARGTWNERGEPVVPGALELFDFADGLLSRRQTVSPDGGGSFGPRHVDFHPTMPWAYVSVETQNRLHMYVLAKGGLSRQPHFVRDTLAEPEGAVQFQMAGAIHVHPNGRAVYVANRSGMAGMPEGDRHAPGGENGIAVFAIDAASGEPVAVQHAPTHGFHPRTFAIDPGGRLLVAANAIAAGERRRDSLVKVPAGLAVFRIEDDGTLSFQRKYDVGTGDGWGSCLFWCGMVAL